MKIFKKLISPLLIGIMVFSLSGCSDKEISVSSFLEKQYLATVNYLEENTDYDNYKDMTVIYKTVLETKLIDEITIDNYKDNDSTIWSKVSVQKIISRKGTGDDTVYNINVVTTQEKTDVTYIEESNSLANESSISETECNYYIGKSDDSNFMITAKCRNTASTGTTNTESYALFDSASDFKTAIEDLTEELNESQTGFLSSLSVVSSNETKTTITKKSENDYSLNSLLASTSAQTKGYMNTKGHINVDIKNNRFSYVNFDINFERYAIDELSSAGVIGQELMFTDPNDVTKPFVVSTLVDDPYDILDEIN